MIDTINPSPITPASGFYQAIARACADTRVEKVIELGAGAGDGATRALLSALGTKPVGNVRLVCIELSGRKFELLSAALAPYTFASAMNGYEVGVDDYPDITEVGEFYWESEEALAFRKRRLKLDIWRQLEEEIAYIDTRTSVQEDRLAAAISLLGTDIDMVVMNGSEFTGEQQWDILDELDPPPLYIAMNGTNSMQNHTRALALEAAAGTWRIIGSGTQDGLDWKVFKYIGS